jgi:hypothetical protein
LATTEAIGSPEHDPPIVTPGREVGEPRDQVRPVDRRRRTSAAQRRPPAPNPTAKTPEMMWPSVELMRQRTV